MKLLALMVLLTQSPWTPAQSVDSQTSSLDSQFSNPGQLSDKQMEEAKNFIHQGKKNQEFEQKCKDIGGCYDKGEGFPIEMVIGKVYTLLGMMDGGMKLNRKVKTTDGTKQTEEMTDYCLMSATLYEGVSGILQTALQKSGENAQLKANDEQLRALIHLQETHKARQKTANWQSYMYGGVTACYGFLLASRVVPDKKFIMRMGASAALTGLYIKKANKEKNRAEAVQKVIKALETAGSQCNPWTKTSCFCSEKTSKDYYPDQYQEICVLNKGNFETPKIAMGCISTQDKKNQFDKECKCKATGTCLKSPLSSLSTTFNTPNSMMAISNQKFDLLSRGEFDQAQLDKASLGLAQMSSRMKLPDGPEFKSVAIPQGELLGAYNELKNYMPPQVAAYTAGLTPTFKNGNTPDNSRALMGKISPDLKQKVEDAIAVEYKSGPGKVNSNSSPEFTLPSLELSTNETDSSSEILEFADKAMERGADVNNTPTTEIFEIISNRYRLSGWKKLSPTQE